jgi:K+-transporting ATPase ATPase C chain
MLKEIRPALLLFLLLTLLTGVIYPLLVTGLGQALFPRQAKGSLIEKGGKLVGSELIGQNFAGPRYFWSRPSATGPYPYNAASSSGSNQGPVNPALLDAIKARVEALKRAHPGQQGLAPVDLVTASGSGLDPHISPAAAAYQIERVAAARNLPTDRVRAVVAQYTAPRQWGILGEARVNVLLLNLALDEVH